MLCVNVELKERRYPIYIGEGLLKDETMLSAEERGSK